MKSTIVVVLACLILAPAVQSQTKVVHFKKLQEFLPSANVKGFERKKPTGQTQSAMGMTTSEAKVRYVTKPASENEENYIEQSIEITLSDMSGFPYAGMAMMQYQQDFENETEDGYEKSTTVKGYKGKESARTGESKSCEIEFMVGSRYIFKLEGDGFSDAQILVKLVESVDLAKLEKLTP
jgi:hypothetical protein